MAHRHPDHPDSHGVECFGCRIKSVGWSYPYGREDFHGETVRERANKQVEEARGAGLDPVNVGNRWI